MKNTNEGTWILKPNFLNCGNGIKMVGNIKKFKDDYLRLKSIAYSIKSGKVFILNEQSSG